MKFFHLSDLHLGLRLIQRDMAPDQEHILQQVIQLARREQPDALVVAGDLYDKAVPSAEAVTLMNRFVTQLTQALPNLVVMMIGGNHDSGPRIDCFRWVLERQRVHMVGMPPVTEGEFIHRVTLEDGYGPVHFYLLPFVRPSMVKQVVGVREDGSACSYDESIRRLLAREEFPAQARTVLVSHQFYLPVGADPQEVERMDSEVPIVGNIDRVGADVLDGFDYVALGHIHKPMTVGKPHIRYCGTPMACSVSEAGQRKGVVQVVLGAPGTPPEITVLPLTPLHEIRVIRGSVEEILAQGSEDYVSVVLTGGDTGSVDLLPRIRQAFPNLLEVRVEQREWALQDLALTQERLVDPLQLCCDFLGQLEQDERDILLDVLHTVQGGK